MESMTLDKLRLSRGISQTTLSERLGITQAAVSKLEFRSDSYISSVRKFIEGIGGQLELNVTFPDGKKVRIAGLDGDGILGDLRKMSDRQALCRINPLSPSNQNNEFRIRLIDEAEKQVELEKTSNNNIVYVPLRRIVEILPEGSGKHPTLVLKGSIRWMADIERWRFVE